MCDVYQNLNNELSPLYKETIDKIIEQEINMSDIETVCNRSIRIPFSLSCKLDLNYAKEEDTKRKLANILEIKILQDDVIENEKKKVEYTESLDAITKKVEEGNFNLKEIESLTKKFLVNVKNYFKKAPSKFDIIENKDGCDKIDMLYIALNISVARAVNQAMDEQKTAAGEEKSAADMKFAEAKKYFENVHLNKNYLKISFRFFFIPKSTLLFCSNFITSLSNPSKRVQQNFTGKNDKILLLSLWLY
uniref:Uncharacterized protein n=1 Tax=Ditylenchus dipsaci TaxID=166011 RepID=A0A915ECZ6_9BILA